MHESASISYHCLSIASPSPKNGLIQTPKKQQIMALTLFILTSILNFISEKIVVHDEAGKIRNVYKTPSAGFTR